MAIPVVKFQIWVYKKTNRLLPTLRSWIKGYTRLLFFRKKSSLPALIWVYPFIKIWKKILPPRLFEPTRFLFLGDTYSFLTLIWIDRAVQIRLLKYIYCDWIVRYLARCLSFCKFILPAYLIQMYSSLPVYLIHLYLPVYKI